MIATHNTTPGTVQMAPIATATVVGCGLVMPGRPAHGLLLPPHMNRQSAPTTVDRHTVPGGPPGGGARRMQGCSSNGLELCVQMGVMHRAGGALCTTQVCSHSSKPFEQERVPGLADPPGGHRTAMASIIVSVRTGGPCAAGVINHEPAGRA